MKKFILLALVGLLYVGSASAQAGSVNFLKSTYSLNSDTIVNTATKYLYLAAPISGYQKVVTVNVNLTEISGTTGGTITLEESLDGTNYYSAFYGTDSTYSFTPADVASQSYKFKLTDFRGRYLRVKYVGTGTMSTIIAGRYLY